MNAKSAIFVLCLLVFGGVGARALAQEPRLPNEIITKTNPLSAVERERVEEFADYWVRRLSPAPDATNPQAAINEARLRLIGPLFQPNVSVPFLQAYSDALVDPLAQLMLGENPWDRINAAHILARLGTDRSVRALAANVAAEDPVLRRWAIKGITRTFADFARRPVTPATALETTRALADAAAAEPQPGLLREQLRALASIQAGLAAAGQPVAPVREAQLDVVRRRLETIGERERVATEIVVLGEALQRLRNELLRLSTQEQRVVGPVLVVHCGDLWQAALDRWEASHADEDDRVAFQEAIFACEEFARFADEQLLRTRGTPPTPQTGLAAAWEANDRAAYEAALARWREIFETSDVYGG